MGIASFRAMQGFITHFITQIIYGKTGYIGEHLSPILGGIMGWIKFLIPIGTFVIAIAIASDRKDLMSTKLFELIVFLVFLI